MMCFPPPKPVVPIVASTFSILELKLPSDVDMATAVEPVTHGGWMFFRTYLLQRGALDGFDGLVISLSKAGGSFLKYAKLLEAQRHRGNSLTRK